MLTIHLFPGFQEVLGIRISNKPKLCLPKERMRQKQRDRKGDEKTDLLTQSVTNDTSLLERGVLVECARKNVIRDVVTKISDKQPEPA